MTLEELMNDLQGQKTNQEDPNHISLEKLFNEAFMSKHSSYKSFDEFLIKGNFQVKTEEDVNNIPDELFDRHIDRETEFANWKSMLETANMEYNRI
ncbi:MAG TPA: hypothetical protein VGI33_10550 [Paenibacillus sp.]